MAATNPEDLKKAYKKERDPRVRVRMVAANMVCILDYSISDTAELLMECPDRVSHWARRFEEGGIDALRDLSPRREDVPSQAGHREARQSAVPRAQRPR